MRTNCPLKKKAGKIRKLYLFLCLIISISLLILSGCSVGNGQNGVSGEGDKNIISDTQFKLDTTVTIKLYDWEDTSTLDRAFGEIDRLENLLSVEKEGSDPDRLFQNAGKEYISVSDEMIEILEKSKEYSELSEGLFDVTSGPLISLWNIRDGDGHIPSDEELSKVLPLIDYTKILIDGNKVMLSEEGMKVNLGAIAKGYIADKISEQIVSEGVKSATLSLGGNVVTIGNKPDGSQFNIGIQDPAGDTGKTIATIKVSDTSLVSSGNYERYFEKNGKRYHHILSPETGFPAENGISGVTIITKESVDADALSTTVFLMGPEKGLNLAESRDGVEAVIISDKGEVTTTSGLDGKLVLQK